MMRARAAAEGAAAAGARAVSAVADARTSVRAAVMAAVMLAAEAGVLGAAGRGRGSVYAQLALRDDALERQRIRDDGIFCSSCALLRLPDHFFPATLAPRVPPSRRRCVFCIRAIRANFD